MKTRTQVQPTNLDSLKSFHSKGQTIIALRPKTRQEIAEEYAISTRTLQRWLKKEEITLQRGLVKRHELELIYTVFGWPSS